MLEQDISIYDYRKKKEKQNHTYVLEEKIHGKFLKHSVRTKQAGYIDFHIYRPEVSWGNERLPILINLHGGGFVLGYPEQDGIYCQRLANNGYCAVINIDYSLAPEFKFPIAIETTYEVILEIMNHAEDLSLDPKAISILGHSAGGNIAAALSLMDQKQRNIDFNQMVLNYPLLDLEEFVKAKRNNHITDANSRLIDYMEWYLESLNDAKSPYASPINGDLSQLPETFILGAELDPLLNKTIEFYEKAKLTETEIQLKIYKDCPHGFTHQWFDEFKEEKAEEAWEDIQEFLFK